MKSVFTYRQFAWHLNSFTDCAKLGITWCYVVSTGMMSSLCPNENVVTHLNCNCLKVYFHGRAVLSGETKSKTEECCARVKLKVLVFYHVEIWQGLGWKVWFSTMMRMNREWDVSSDFLQWWELTGTGMEVLIFYHDVNEQGLGWKFWFPTMMRIDRDCVIFTHWVLTWTRVKVLILACLDKALGLVRIPSVRNYPPTKKQTKT